MSLVSAPLHLLAFWGRWGVRFEFNPSDAAGMQEIGMRWRQRNSFNLFGSQYFTSGIFLQLCENWWMCSKFSGLPIRSQLPSDKPPFILNCTVWLAQMPVCGLLIGSALSLWPESVYILYFCRARWWWKWHYHTQFRMVSSTQVKHIKEFTFEN